MNETPTQTHADNDVKTESQADNLSEAATKDQADSHSDVVSEEQVDIEAEIQADDDSEGVFEEQINNDSEAAEWVPEKLLQIVEAALLSAGQPLTLVQLGKLFIEHERPTNNLLKEALALLDEQCAKRGIELKQVASGYRLQAREELQPWISRLWQERPKRYSRALLETMALIAYRQPITRAEIEDVRGVSVSSNIIRTLLERNWIREVGHRDVPGRPALFGTTKVFLDSFNLKSLDELPTLAEIQDLGSLEPELELQHPNSTETNDEESSNIDMDDEDNPPDDKMTISSEEE